MICSTFRYNWCYLRSLWNFVLSCFIRIPLCAVTFSWWWRLRTSVLYSWYGLPSQTDWSVEVRQSSSPVPSFFVWISYSSSLLSLLSLLFLCFYHPYMTYFALHRHKDLSLAHSLTHSLLFYISLFPKKVSSSVNFR